MKKKNGSIGSRVNMVNDFNERNKKIEVKVLDFKEYTGKNIDDALTNACVDLGTTTDKLEYEVISKGSNGILGIGSKPAVIKARKISQLKTLQENF